MRLDTAGTFTGTNHRFFAPKYGDVLHHQSFDPTGKPQAEALAGAEACIVVEDPAGQTEAYEAWLVGYVPSGSLVKQIATFPDSHFLDWEINPSDLENPVASYTVQPDDQLIIVPERASLSAASPLGKTSRDASGVLVVPASERLPYANGTSTDDGQANPVRYKIAGVITGEEKLITWPNMYGGGSRTVRWVDYSVVQHEARSRLELALLSSALGSVSLVGMVDCTPGAAAYLTHYDATHGTEYRPTRDPYQLLNAQFTGVELDMTELETYDRISGLQYPS